MRARKEPQGVLARELSRMADGEEVITPVVEYADDDKDPENYVKVCVDIPGLKSKILSRSGSAKNAVINLDVEERSFTVRITVTLSKETRTYEYSVKQLPEAITPDLGKTYTKVKRDNEVIVYLHKARPGKWARMLSCNGLETAKIEKP